MASGAVSGEHPPAFSMGPASFCVYSIDNLPYLLNDGADLNPAGMLTSVNINPSSITCLNFKKICNIAVAQAACQHT